MNTTWWRTHPVGHRLLAVGALQLAASVVSGPDLAGLLWLLLTLWLLHRVRRSSGVAWVVLLVVNVLAVALAVLALLAGSAAVATGVAAAVLGAARVALLLTPAVRGWVGRSGLLSLPGEH